MSRDTHTHLYVDKLIEGSVLVKLAQHPAPCEDVGGGGNGATPTFYCHETVVLEVT